jgi:hypothetical protein
MLVAPSTLLEEFSSAPCGRRQRRPGQWTVLVSREVERPLNEGTFHRGTASVTQFVARKNAELPDELDDCVSSPLGRCV